MSNILQEPGFENSGASWTFNSLGSVVENGNERSGDACALLITRSLLGGPWSSGQMTSTAFKTVLGWKYDVSFWGFETDPSISNQRLRIRVYDGPSDSGPWTENDDPGNDLLQTTDSYTQFTGSFTALDAYARIIIDAYTSGSPTTPSLTQTNAFYVDDVAVEMQGVDRVARLIYEKSLAALLGSLQAAMPTILDDIETERGDGLSLPDVDLWSYVKLPDFVGEQVQLEVYCDSFDFPTPERNLSTWQAGATRIITTRCQLTARLTHVNRDQADIAQMGKRTQRYTAAIARAISDNPTLTVSGTDYVDHCILVRGDTDRREIVSPDRSPRIADTIVFQMESLQHETDANEGTSGAAASFTSHQ